MKRDLRDLPYMSYQPMSSPWHTSIKDSYNFHITFIDRISTNVNSMTLSDRGVALTLIIREKLDKNSEPLYHSRIPQDFHFGGTKWAKCVRDVDAFRLYKMGWKPIVNHEDHTTIKGKRMTATGGIYSPIELAPTIDDHYVHKAVPLSSTLPTVLIPPIYTKNEEPLKANDKTLNFMMTRGMPNWQSFQEMNGYVPLKNGSIVPICWAIGSTLTINGGSHYPCPIHASEEKNAIGFIPQVLDTMILEKIIKERKTFMYKFDATNDETCSKKCPIYTALENAVILERKLFGYYDCDLSVRVNTPPYDKERRENE